MSSKRTSLGDFVLFAANTLVKVALLIVAVAAMVAVFQLVFGGCSVASSTLHATGDVLEGGSIAGSSTKMGIKNSTVWTNPEVLTRGDNKGMVKFTAKLTQGVEVLVYCPTNMVEKCVGLMPGQQIASMKGWYTEARMPNPEQQGESLTSQEYAESRLHGKGDILIKPAMYLRSINPRKPTYPTGKER